MSSDAPINPLALAHRDPLVGELIERLSRARTQLESDETVELSFSRAWLRQTRANFREGIRSGEATLHHFCHLLGRVLLHEQYRLQSVVIGEAGDERFTLSQTLDEALLFAETDLDLGNRLLSAVRLQDDDGNWGQPRLVANFVEYQPEHLDDLAIHKMISRIKAEEEIWNKVVDEIFHLDELVQRDKQLRRLSRYVKDVFGVKIVVGVSANVRPLQAALEQLQFSDALLEAANVPASRSTERPRILEVKDYMAQGKRSGWEAVKTVVSWWDIPVEIQIQPLINYFREREYLTRESHAAFKERRDRVREEIALQVPLFGHYRDLLQWLFTDVGPEGPTPPPHHPRLSVRLTD